ncbi:zinc phosphodiesterase ELAC protein 1-like isoform X2 [Bacillus rossius redtenbacheri]|uniref:zinc phosphodiesterase ELAC protein 1-like isoform X2 n=1 Tax=Bacillus rossius redtenbacheri TaxID=93214 RepID=UPI002FDE6CA9
MKIDITFLGTASCYPTPHRSVSCTAVRFEDGSVWLFDCGEGSQIQLQKSSVKPGRVSKIFITHLHGDHVFGLPGLVCTLGTAWQGKADADALLEVFGPKGLRSYLRRSLALSRSLLPFHYTVHELVPVPEQFPADWGAWPVDHEAAGPTHPQERLGRDIPVAREDDRCTWHLDGCAGVRAGMIHHTIPSFGFAVELASQPGQLDAGRLRELGLPPGPLYGALKRGEEVTLPGGLVIRPSEVVGPPKRGLKATILGDTSDPSPMEHLARGSDVLLHEATMRDGERDKALEFGHSTPAMAAGFADRAGARRLVLYHFSQRYRPAGPGTDPQETVAVLLEEARAALPRGSVCEVSAAEDLLEMTVS